MTTPDACSTDILSLRLDIARLTPRKRYAVARALRKLADEVEREDTSADRAGAPVFLFTTSEF